MTKLIKNATIVNEGASFTGTVLIDNDGNITRIIKGLYDITILPSDCDVIDATGLYLIPGCIDDQVHFREPGLTYKADIQSESRAAVAGGVTSYMEMPNTKPPTTTREAIEWKQQRASQVSSANYSFWIGATNDNIDEINRLDYSRICGIKLFMGSSTGNMLVDNDKSLNNLFANAPCLIATHCEDEATVKNNLQKFRERYGEDVPWRCHAEIRSAEACVISSTKAARLARKYGTKLHILHLSTAEELSLLDNGDLDKRQITGEVCVHHLWFSEEDYAKYGSRIKWNPSIKYASDREALRNAVREGLIPVIATDHAPHTLEEKNQNYFQAPSGGPLVQFSLIASLTLASQGLWSIEDVVDRMCHAPALLFGVKNRGFIRVGYKADLVLLKKEPFSVTQDCIKSKCGWSPFEGTVFDWTVKETFINGQSVFKNGKINDSVRGECLEFIR